MRYLLILFLFISFSVNAVAQSYGIYSSFNYNRTESDLLQIPGFADSARQSAVGHSVGFSLGGFFEYPLAEKVAVALRAYFCYRPTDISVNISSVVFDKTIVPTATVATSLQAGSSALFIEPLVKYRFTPRFSLLGGFNVGWWLNKKVAMTQTIKSPSNSSFSDGYKTKHYSDIMENASGLQFALTAGVSYQFPIDSRNIKYIEPELVYTFGFMDVKNNFTWDINSFRAGVSLKFSMNALPEPEPKEEPPPKVEEVAKVVPPPVEERESYSGKIETYNEKNIQVDTLLLREYSSNSIQSLLNYIFFDDNSGEIPKRYVLLSPEEARRFSSEKLNNTSAMNVYYNLLNIIGERLRAYPSAKIEITGCNSDFASEKGNIPLSEKRAVAVFDYLKNSFEIAPDRMLVKTRNLPEKASVGGIEEVIAENRRVEINSAYPEILYPLFKNELIYEANPEIMKISAKLDKQYVFKFWQFNILQNDKVINTFSGEGKFSAPVEWSVYNNINSLSEQPIRLEVAFAGLTRDEKQVINLKKTIHVQKESFNSPKYKRKQKKKFENFNLILFDFDDYSMNDANRKLLEFVKTRVSPDSKVFIEGYTDNIGDATHNLSLSEMRAKSTAEALKPNISSKIKLFPKGFGESVLLFDNKYPEGRFYCRTVKIKIETTVE